MGTWRICNCRIEDEGIEDEGIEDEGIEGRPLYHVESGVALIFPGTT